MNLLIFFMIIAAGICLILFIYTVIHYTSDRSFFLLFSSMCCFLYTFGYLLEITSPTLEAAFIGVRVQKMGSLFIPILNYLFVMDIYEEKRFSPKGYCLLFALPILNFITAQAFPWSRDVYKRQAQYFAPKSSQTIQCPCFPFGQRSHLKSQPFDRTPNQ